MCPLQPWTACPSTWVQAKAWARNLHDSKRVWSPGTWHECCPTRKARQPLGGERQRHGMSRKTRRPTLSEGQPRHFVCARHLLVVVPTLPPRNAPTDMCQVSCIARNLTVTLSRVHWKLPPACYLTIPISFLPCVRGDWRAGPFAHAKKCPWTTKEPTCMCHALCISFPPPQSSAC
ncbi:hypothetical protein BS50DRAFT_322111 [Corynespora cassiicola Philippines]|uniref:Uncharacterized protein n=1 Tax=Corynespora cassiicola Philippines TaxID=1448308 RepID=A0A2T2NTE6_CORCC|nr:hypothetical protein BS50DRAFT_322111 [Corynespora cassiicola Philippines]